MAFCSIYRKLLSVMCYTNTVCNSNCNSDVFNWGRYILWHNVPRHIARHHYVWCRFSYTFGVVSEKLSSVIFCSLRRLFDFRIDAVQIVFVIVAAAMAALGFMILFVGCLATGATRHKVYRAWGSRVGGRVSCAVFMGVTYILKLCWIAILCFLAVVVFVFTIFWNMCSNPRVQTHFNCIELNQFCKSSSSSILKILPRLSLQISYSRAEYVRRTWKYAKNLRWKLSARMASNKPNQCSYWHSSPVCSSFSVSCIISCAWQLTTHTSGTTKSSKSSRKCTISPNSSSNRRKIDSRIRPTRWCSLSRKWIIVVPWRSGTLLKFKSDGGGFRKATSKVFQFRFLF